MENCGVQNKPFSAVFLTWKLPVTDPTTTSPPSWIRGWLLAAGFYNLAWGAANIIWPNALFDFAGAKRVNYPEIWQCVGMIVGVYGIGYAIAAGDSRRHWPIVLVGLLGKIFGPIGFAWSLWNGVFPPLFGVTLLTNDLLWWIPFVLILKDAAKFHGFSSSINRRFVMESNIAATPETVFQFHESPGALTHLIPPWENVKAVESSGSLQPGARVVLQGNVGPVPVRWVAMHTEYRYPTMFADRQESGPFAFWYHRHFCLENSRGGTLLRDEVEYRAPFGFLGMLFGDWIIRRKLQNMFNYRHETTRKLVESGAWRVSVA
jgi:ligand-binding SRPBCC domain-containing protein